MLEHSMLYPKTTLTRRRISMDGMWKFCLDEKAVGEKEGWMDGIPGEEMIPVPASFQDFYTEKDIREYTDRKSTRLNSSHSRKSRMPSSA